jgi:hypothetical protein
MMKEQLIGLIIGEAIEGLLELGGKLKLVFTI